MSYNRAGASSRDRGRDPPKWLNRNRAYDRNRDDDRNRNRDGNRYNDWNRDRGRNRLNNYSTYRERDRWRDRGRDRDSDQENERVRERDRDNDRDPKGEKKDESRDSKNSSIEEQFKQLFTRIGSTLGLEDLDSLTPDEGLSILQENVSSILGDKVKIELEEDDKKSDEGMLSPQLQILKLLEKLESVIQKNLVAAEANVNDEGIFPTSDQLIEQKSRSRSPDKSETASEKQTAENNSRRRSRDRSRSISRKSRSKSPSTSRRSRSKSLSKPRRSRSKSPLRSKRSRSKSPLRSRRSKSRSPSWRHRRGGYKLRRSRSKSISLSPPRYSRRRVTSPLRYGNRRRSYSPPVRWRRTPSRSPPRPPPPTLNTPWQPTNYYPQPDPTLEVGSYGVTPSYAGGIQNYIAPQPPNYYDGGQLGGYPPPMDYSGGMPPWHPPNMMPPPGINPHVPRPQLPVPESKDNITVDLTSSENNTQPPKNVVDSEEAKNLAIENEAAQQRITLINQRAEYLKKRDTLQRDLKMLQNQKKAILMDKASPENESVLKENHTLQTEINNKLKAIGNVIDMLDSIIRPKKEDEEDIKKTEENKDLEAIGNVIGVLNNIIGPKGKEDGEVAKTVESDTSSKEPRQRSKSPVAGRKLPDEQTPPPEQKKSPEKPQFNYVYYDPELHWCKVCNTFPRTAKEFLHHMHSEEHKNITKERNIQDFPWHKFQEPDDPKAASDAPVKRVPIKGLQFFISSTAWYCKLCDHWIGDLHCASRHLKSAKHSKAYNDFIVEHPNWELDWLANRSRAYEKKADEKQLKEESQQLNEKQKVIPNSETLQTMEKVPQEDASISSSNQEDAREKLRRALSLSIGQKIKAVLVKKENDRNKSKNNDRHKSVPNKRARSGSSSSRSSDSNHDQKRRSKDKHKKKLDRDSIPKEKKLTKPPHIMVQVPDLKCRWDEPATPADNRSSSKDRFDDKEWMSEPKSTVEGELLHKKQELKTQIKQRVDQDEKHYIKQSEIQMKQNRRERDKDDSKTRSEKEDNKKRDKGIKKPSKVLQHKGIKENNSDAEVEKHTKKEPGLSDDSDEKDISLNAQKDLAKKPVIKIVNPKSPFIGKMPFLDKFLAKKKKELDKELVIKEEEVPAALDCGTSSSQTVVTTQQIPLPQKMTASQPMPPPKELPPPKIPLPSQMPTSQEIPPLQQRSSSSPPQTFVTTQQMPPPQKSLLAAEKFSMPPLPQTAVTIQQMPPPQQSLLIAQDFSLPPPQALVITQQMPPPHQSPLTAQDFSVLPPQTVVTTQQMPPPQQSSLTAQDFSVPPPQALVTTQQMPPPNLLTPPPPPPLPVPPPVVEMDPCRPIMRPIRPLMGPLGPLDIPPGPPRMRPPGPPGMGSGPPRMRPPGPPGMGPPGPPRMCPPGMGSGPPRMCPPGPPGMGPPGPSTNCQNNKKTSSSIKWVIYKNEDGDSKKKEPSKKPEEAQKREESKKEEDDKKRMELELLGIDADDMAAHDFVL